MAGREVFILENSKINFQAVNKILKDKLGSILHIFTDFRLLEKTLKSKDNFTLVIDTMAPHFDKVLASVKEKNVKQIVLIHKKSECNSFSNADCILKNNSSHTELISKIDEHIRPENKKELPS
ncbi:MAG: hypothetical protein ACK40G_13235 [Cytophagaceae bacterium]